MLTLENITCRRGDKTLFRELGLTIGDNAFVVVKGGNGAGKSSLLRIIACLLEPDEGQVLYANEDVRGEHFEEYCDIVHYMGHDLALNPMLSVSENLYFWAKLRGNETLIPAALSYFELLPYQEVPVYQLSAGQKQRVALSRVLVSNGDIWLLDEPFNHLDESMHLKLLSLLETRCTQGGSVILTSHNDAGLEDKRILQLEDWK